MASIESYQTAKGVRYRERSRKPGAHNATDKRGFARKRDARLWAAAHIADDTYADPAKGRITIGEFYERWVGERENIWKPSYTQTIRVCWKHQVQTTWDRVRITDVSHSGVQEWVNGLADRYSPTITLRAFRIIKGLLLSTKRDRVVRRTPAIEQIKLPHKPSRKNDRHYLTVRQLIDLADNCGGYRAFVLGFCGLRWGEMAGMVREDVDLGNLRGHVRHTITKVGAEYVGGEPKSWEMRDVPIPRGMLAVFEKAMKDAGPGEHVFTDGDGHAPRPQSAGRGAHGWWVKALENSGLPLMPPHDLRHTAASIPVSAEANVKVLQRMLSAIRARP